MSAAPTATMLTIDEFGSLPDDGMRHELVAGALVSMPPLNRATQRSNRTSTWRWPLSFCDTAWARSSPKPAMSWAKIPRPSGLPDVSFRAAPSFAEADPDEYPRGAPTLAIEVISPSDRPRLTDEKVAQYFSAGSEAVWVFDPKTVSVSVHRQNQTVQVFGRGETLTDPLFTGLERRSRSTVRSVGARQALAGLRSPSTAAAAAVSCGSLTPCP